MHLLTVSENKQVGAIDLRPGKYMVEDINGAEMLAREVGTLEYQDVTSPYGQGALHAHPVENDDLNGKTIVIARPGGIGDLLMLTPSLRAIKARWPDCRLHVACFDVFAPIFDYNADVDVAGFYPLNVEVWNKASVRVWLENAIEKGYEGRHTPAIDLFAERIGIAPLVDKKIRYEMLHTEHIRALMRFPKQQGKKRIGIQVYASARSRTYPEQKTIELVKLLHKKGYEIFIFGSPGQVKSDSGPDFVNLTLEEPALSFRESAAVLKTCDALIGPDSALIHLASALEVPAVALYAAFPWQLRTGYAEKTFAMQGKCPLAPCFFHERNGVLWPKGGPCEKSGGCDALGTIEPERIVAKLESLI